MSDVTRVYLITGFLGSGKTTLLNRIIGRFPKTKKLTLLVNEFGEVGVDGTLVEGDDIDMMEISKGSIFCVCVKTDFIKGLYELNTKVRPDVLLIESTGVANPSDLKKDLKLPIFNDALISRSSSASSMPPTFWTLTILTLLSRSKLLPPASLSSTRLMQLHANRSSRSKR